MAATARQERELKQKYQKLLKDPSLTPLEKLRAYVMSKGTRSLKSLHRLFKKIDQTKDGQLHFEEFQSALHAYAIRVELSIEKQLFQEIDRDGTGFISYDEFLIALRPPMSERRLNLVHQAFDKLDKTKDGVVTADDLKGVYNGKRHPKYLSGEWSEDDVLKEWLNSFNGDDDDGQVTRDEFEDYYAGVSASIDTDAYFDLMMRQAWKL